jgi:hypothetical protein
MTFVLNEPNNRLPCPELTLVVVFEPTCGTFVGPVTQMPASSKTGSGAGL